MVRGGGSQQEMPIDDTRSMGNIAGFLNRLRGAPAVAHTTPTEATLHSGHLWKGDRGGEAFLQAGTKSVRKGENLLEKKERGLLKVAAGQKLLAERGNVLPMTSIP